MAEKLRKVELIYNGFTWYCDDCGLLNYGTMMRPCGQDEINTVEALMDMTGCSEFEARQEAINGEWMIQPSTVKCKDCGAKFDATDQMRPDGKNDEDDD